MSDHMANIGETPSTSAHSPDFYEKFWADAGYQLRYAFCSASLDRYPAIERVWGSLARPRRVLDFGSGNGVLSYWLHSNRFGESVTGVDVSRTGVRNANAHFGREGLRFLLAAELDWSAEKFDAVVSSHVLEHVDNPAEALSKLAPIAEWFVIEVPLESCVWVKTLAALRGKALRDNPLGHVNFWTRATFNILLAQSGYLVVRDYQYASAPFFPDTPPVKRWIERMLLRVLGVRLYGRLLATHYIVLARKNPVDPRWRTAGSQ